MANGELSERQLDRLEDYIIRLESKIDKLGDSVEKINTSGCAHRASDLGRIEALERWRDKGVIGIIAIAGAMITEFFALHR